MARATTKSKSELRRDKARTAFRHAARAILEEEGWAGCTTNKIVDRSGFSRATLYNHFASKDALIAELLSDIVDALLVEPYKRWPGSDGRRSVRDGISAGFNYIFDVVERDRALLAAIDEGLRTSPTLVQCWRSFEERQLTRTIHDFESGRSLGILRPDVDLPLLAHAMCATTDAMIWKHVRSSAFKSREVARIVGEIYWNSAYGQPHGPEDYVLGHDDVLRA